MKIDLFNQLIALLETERVRKHFYMQRFFGIAVVGPGLPELDCIDGTCTTAACVAGWATTIPGTHLWQPMHNVVEHVPTSFTGYGAFAAAFGITDEEAEYICDPDQYYEPAESISATYAISHIREVMAKYEPATV